LRLPFGGGWLLAARALRRRHGPRGFGFLWSVSADSFGFRQAADLWRCGARFWLRPASLKSQGYRAEFPILVLFAALGMGIMVSATDMLTLYVGLELNSLAFMCWRPCCAQMTVRRKRASSTSCWVRWLRASCSSASA
jgi:hypothetical protein